MDGRGIKRCYRSWSDRAVDGVFQIFGEKPYVRFKNVLVIVENIELIREQVVVFD